MKRVLKKVEFRFLFLILGLVCLSLGLTSAQSSAANIILYASEAPVKVGNWRVVSDPTAAGGARLDNNDYGGYKFAEPLAYPAVDYFEMTFNAQAGVPYRLWMRAKAVNNSPYNDSVFIQFSGSVDASGTPLFRIGTTSGTTYNLEDCSGCGLSGWGWQDNGWGVGVMGQPIYFQSTGTQTLKVQIREDGISIDQIVLSPSSYLNSSPGALKNDSTILTKTGAPPPAAAAPSVTSISPNSGSTSGGTSVTITGSNFTSGATVSFGGTAATSVNVLSSTSIAAVTPARAAGVVDVVVKNTDGQSGTLSAAFTYVAPPPPPPPPPPAPSASNIVIWATDIPNGNIVGNWSKAYDSTAAGATALRNSDLGVPKLATALSNPSSYFDITFNAQAGTAYHLWVRGKAEGNSPYNDSVFVQFSGSVDSSGSAIYRIGTANGATVNIEEDLSRGLSGWGWQDNGWGAGVMGQPIYFQSTGAQTLRVQVREDGISIDQIVLSPSSYLNSSPGALKDDSLILPSTIGTTLPPPPPPPNLPPVVSVSASPISGLAPLPVSFNSTSSDPDGYIASYSWNFGDGQSANVPYPSHTYGSAGTYTARLTVTDNAGATASASVIITASAPPPPSGAVTLKVLTWNAQFGNGTDGVHNLDRQATWIANMKADVVAMCEVTRDASEDQPQLLKNLLTQKTGVSWYLHFVPKYVGTSEGNLILTKWTVVSTSFLYLSYQRSIAQMTINVNGKLINFFATHLDAYTASYRAQEMTELTSFAAGFAEPRIICGDFNASPDWPEISGMTANYYDSWSDAFYAGTAVAYPDNPVQWQTRTRKGRIDYVYYSRGASNLVLKGTQIPDQRDLSRSASVTIGTTDDRGVRPSDHNFMVATFDLR